MNLTITIISLLVTNWSAQPTDGYLLGLIRSNTVARVPFGGVTNEFVLQSVPVGATFRDAPNVSVTNVFIGGQDWITLPYWQGWQNDRSQWDQNR